MRMHVLTMNRGEKVSDMPCYIPPPQYEYNKLYMYLVCYHIL